MNGLQTLETYQVHLKLPEIFTRRFSALIPKQRERVNQLMEARVILNYALDMDRANLWVTMQARSNKEVMDILATFPIISFVNVEIFEISLLRFGSNGFTRIDYELKSAIDFIL